MKRTFISGISINRNKATIDLNKHGDIMEDALNRIKVKEAMNTGEFVDWEDAKQVKKCNCLILCPFAIGYPNFSNVIKPSISS